MRQLKRLSAVSKSPIFSHFGETLTGVSTIRAYSASGRFMSILDETVNEHLIYFYPDTISNRWLGQRIELIGNFFTLFASLFAVISRDTLSGGLAGLSISYALSVTSNLNWAIRMSAEFESSITSVERIKEYCQTDTHEVS
jgi:ABC-type multidrug transport system fused ATPase/permease subunit